MPPWPRTSRFRVRKSTRSCPRRRGCRTCTAAGWRGLASAAGFGGCVVALVAADYGFALVKQSERDELDLSASVWVSKRKLLTHPHHQFRPNDPGRVMRAGLCRRVATAPRDVSADRVLAGHGLAPLADVVDGQRCDRLPELVVGREHAVIAMPVLPRRWHKISEPVQELKRRELDDAVGTRSRGLSPAARADPVRCFVSREHLADARDATAPVTSHREPLQCEGGLGAIPQRRASPRGCRRRPCGAASSRGGAARTGERDDEPTACRRIAWRQVWLLVTACRT